MNWNEPASLDGRYFGPIPRDGTFAEARMSPLAVLRGISDVVAHLTLRPRGAGYPTARWQDKSRRLRLGRVVEECRNIKRLARGATAHDSLPIRTTPCNFTTARTSHRSAP